MRSITYLASEKLVYKFVETNGGLLVDVLKLQHFTGCNSEVRLPPCVDRVMHGFTKYFRSTCGLFCNLYSRYTTRSDSSVYNNSVYSASALLLAAGTGGFARRDSESAAS